MREKFGFPGKSSYIYVLEMVPALKIKVMFKLENVLGYLKNVLNYTHSQLLDFCNVVDGECSGDDVFIKAIEIERYLGIPEMRKLECNVVQIINL